MKQNSWLDFNKLVRGALALASLFALVQLFAAQPLVMGNAPRDTQPAVLLEAGTNNDMAVFVPTGHEVRDEGLPQPLKFGNVVFRPHGTYQLIYANGLEAGRFAFPQFGHTNYARLAVNTIIQTVSPGITVDLGRHWTADYTPTIRFYSNDALRDSVDHSASLVGSVFYEDWLLGLSQTFLLTDSSLAETAEQTRQELYETRLTASHQLSEKYSTDLLLRQQLTFVSGAQNSRTWSTLDWLNYQVGKRVYAGIGAGLGYVNVDVGPDQIYEQLLGRLQWRVSEKVSLSVHAGLDYRQFLDDGFSSPLNPIFGGSLQYQPFEHTQITLSADRSVSSSDYFLAAQSSETTTVSLNVNQRFLEKFYLSAGVGYTHTDFSGSFGGNSTVRADDNYFLTARISRNFLKRGNVSVSYQYGDNYSSLPGYNYRSNQVGVEVGFAY